MDPIKFLFLKFLLVILILNNIYSQNRIIVNPGFESGSIVPHTNVQFPSAQNASNPQIDGWYTTHPDIYSYLKPIEHWRDGAYNESTQEGSYFVELNAYQPSRLYQIVYLVNGESIEYSFYHRRRFSTQIETVDFSIFDESGTNKLYVINTHIGDSTWSQTTGSYTFNGPTGVYQIGFEATSPLTGGSGNFLDNINIGLDGLVEFSHNNITISEGDNTYQPYIIVNGNVQNSSTLTFSVTATNSTAGIDFNFNPTTIQIPVGQYGIKDSIPIPLSIVDNALAQGIRSLTLQISSFTGDIEAKDANGDGYKSSLTINITDNDPSTGGVKGANLWLKANKGANQTGGVLSNWKDQTGQNSFTKVGSIGYLENVINFNPIVQFENTNPKNQAPANHLDGNKSIDIVETYAVYKYNTSSKTGVVLGGVDGGPSYGKAFLAADNDLRVYVGTGQNSVYQSYPNGDLVNKFTINNINIAKKDVPFSEGRLNGETAVISNNNGVNFDSLKLIPMIGATENNGNSSGWYYLNGQIAEILCFPKSIDFNDKRKIESYLSLKYGITLHPSINTYRSSENIIFWNIKSHWNDVFGIGQDDGSDLIQASSNSINSGSGDGTGQIGKGNIVVSNPSSLDNNDFLMLGHNSGSLNDQTNDLPNNLKNQCISRLEREWKVQRTGDVGTVNLSFDFNGLSFSGTLGTDTSLFGIIIDIDGDGDFSTGNPQNIQATIKNGDLIRFEDLNLPNNSVFTFYMPIDLSSNFTDVVEACPPFTWIDGKIYNSDNNTATHVIQNQYGCDSTITLNLTLKPLSFGIDTLNSCNAITWIDGNTYSKTDTTATFVITGGASNGCDSIVQLYFTHQPTAFGTDTRNECGPFTWIDGNTYNTDTNGVKHTIIGGAADGCDSIITLNLSILPNKFGTDIISSCNALTWIDGNTYSTSNNTATHVLSGAASNGCDSIVSLDYTHLPTAFGTDNLSECKPYTWIDGKTYLRDTSGVTFNLIGGAADGCDSIVTLNLNIIPNGTSTDVISQCNPLTWIDGITYSNSNNTATFTIPNGSSNGCDSIVTLNFTRLKESNSVDVHVACGSYTWIDGVTYTSSNNTATMTYTNISGCDSIVTLDLTILPISSGIDNITSCNSITWIDGLTYTSSNNSATHILSGAASNGCDSIVTLNFTHLPTAFGTDTRTECAPFTWIDSQLYTANNNTATFTIINGASDGCDSIVTLDLTILPNNTGTDFISSCNSITWLDGKTYSSSNNTATTLLANAGANGCDSIVTLNFTHLPSATGIDTRTECSSLKWIDGNVYTTSNNTATYTIPNGANDGCDSVVTLNLTIIPPSITIDSITSCNSITWIDGNTYSQSNNTATVILPNSSASGCDSIIFLNFNKLSTSIGIDQRTECAPFTWIDGKTYNDNNNSAFFNIPGGASDGCDSTVILNLTIIPQSISYDNYTRCNQLTWIDGNTYYESNYSATHVIPGGAASGCDSIIILNLTIQPSNYSVDTRLECAPFTWIDGITYNEDNNTAVYTYFNGSADGCDSLVSLNLFIDSVNTEVVQSSGTLTAVANNGETYQWLDCDNGNQELAGQTNQSFSPITNGNFAVIVDNGLCSDTSICFSINDVGVNNLEALLNNISVYPNPTKQLININFGKINSQIFIDVKNSLGQNIKSIVIEDSSKTSINLPKVGGVYYIHIIIPSFGKVIKKVIVN